MYNLYHGDCLELMKDIPDKSIDMILCDLPYGTTALEWDKQLDITLLWNEYKRIRKDTTPILLFGQEPFSSLLRCSNINEFKYDWYWEKERPTNIFNVKRRPGKVVEVISVFYKTQCLYIPQKKKALEKNIHDREGGSFSITTANKNTKPSYYKDDGTRYPTQIIKCNRVSNLKTIHPTQKPVKLLDFLIKTYTNEGDLVLDNTMGSGSTGVACMNLGRKFIGIEKDEKYFKIAEERIKEAANNLNKFME